jgi:hypothetical protein
MTLNELLFWLEAVNEFNDDIKTHIQTAQKKP